MSKMQFPSFTLIFSGLFIAYNTYSIYAISQFFSPPPCKSEEYCITSCLKKQLNLKLDLFTSITRHPLNAEVTKVYTDTIFDYTQAKDIPLTLDIPHKTRKNGTLFMHVVLSTISSKPDLTFNQLIKDFDTVYTTIKMTEYALPHTEAYNLLSKDKSTKTKKQDQIPKSQPLAHLKSKITFTIMTDDVQFPINNIPMELANFMKVNNNLQFLPLLNYNFLHTRHENLEKITPKSHSMNVTVTYSPISLGKLRLILHIQEVMQNFKDLGFTDKDVDQVKSILADTNLYLLAATVFISAMHLLFDFLAFKNDISFWKNINNLAGLSTKTVIWCAFSRTVIFLYLLDEESSLLILIPSGIATIIEFWKTKKLLKAEFVWSGSYFPRIRFNLNKSTSAEAKTREFDAESMRYLSYLLYPLVILGAIYSLLYLPHKSWYSWCLHSTVKGVYAFGFLFMLPQLFVNYKLKSVAHLPWKSFMYKAFNTFIDDVFAFIITMPTAHRVACFRDDVVFLIYLYQRWLYPVDKSRIDSSTVDQDPGALDDVMQKKKK